MPSIESAQFFQQSLNSTIPLVVIEEEGWVESVLEDVVTFSGLQGVGYYELLRFHDGSRGMVLELDEGSARAVLLERGPGLKIGGSVKRLKRLVSIPVTDSLLGRLIDPLGNPLDSLAPLNSPQYYPIERDAPPMFQRALVDAQLYTGIKVIDAMFPIGKGQRELILGDPATGKSTLALDAVLNQASQNLKCVYVSIGQKKQAVLDTYTRLKSRGAMDYTVLVSASADETAGAQFIAPYAGTAIAEYFLDLGQDVLIVYDDLSKHAFAYQTLALLLKRPPGREAFPGDIFYAHARLLERACNLRNGGSLTALPIAETQAGRISSYIPTNLISITDGQLNLNSNLFNINQRPAIDIGTSVSRIGGKAQISAFREMAEHLRLNYAQFLEVEVFTKLGVQVQGETARMIERGQRLREMLKQPQHQLYPWYEQVILLFALNAGLLDKIPLNEVTQFAQHGLQHVLETAPDSVQRLRQGQTLTADLKAELKHCFDELTPLNEAPK